MAEFSREPRNHAAYRDGTIARSTPAEQAFASVQELRPRTGAASGHAAVASGLVDARVQRKRSGGRETSSGHAAVASGLVDARVQPKRSGRHDAAVGNVVDASGLVERGHPLQRSGGGQLEEAGAHAAAARGVATPGGPLPHLAAIQMAFGHHDVSGVQAHTSSEARASAETMGADAYATGHHVVFGARSDLFTAAHEAAHVVQQRAGVQLRGGVGESGDIYERHADDVAALVVQGQSAESLLDRFANPRSGAATGPSGVQRMDAQSSLAATGQQLDSTGSLGTERDHQPYLDPADGEHLRRKEVSPRAYARLQIAARAIAATKAVIPYQGNQSSALRATQLNSYHRLRVMRDERCWEYANMETRLLALHHPEAAHAAKAELAGGGGCSEHAWVAFHYVRLHAGGDRVQVVRVGSLDHNFVIIGDLATERDGELVTSDPWPNAPTACLWRDHFAFTRNRSDIRIDSTLTNADERSYKDAISQGLRLSARGLRMLQMAATPEATEEGIARGRSEGWIWDHESTTARNRKFEYYPGTAGRSGWFACLPGRSRVES